MEAKRSVWQATSRHQPRPELMGTVRCDVAVIGGGLTGILAGKLLAQEGLSCVVLEADTIGSGQTGGTTAKITAQHGLVYRKLEQTRGPDIARLYADANTAAIGQYETLIGTLPTDCGFVRCPAYLYTTGAPGQLQLESMAARRAGIQCTITQETELPFPVTAALRFSYQARFHPLEFLYQVAQGLTAYEHSPVRQIHRHRGFTLLRTPKGAVAARYVVFAAHYPLVNVPGWYFTRLHQERSYVLALANAMTPQGMYLGVGERALSFRAEMGYLLLGGCAHRTGEDSGRPYETLLARAKSMFPDCTEVYRWSAQDCVSVDGLPYIGRYAANTPDWFVATGYNKWGMTTAMVAARLCTDLICGRTTPYSVVYDPDRPTAKHPGNLMNEMTHAVKGLTRGLLQGRRCSHMGCRLEWNQAEGTWDCPCHGSRFAPDGTLLNDPAMEDAHIE